MRWRWRWEEKTVVVAVVEEAVVVVGSRPTCICSITFCTSITLTFSTPSASSCARPCSMNSSRTCIWECGVGDVRCHVTPAPARDELLAHLLAQLVRGQRPIRVVLLAPLGPHPLGDLLASSALGELAQDEREAFGEVRLEDAGDHG